MATGLTLFCAGQTLGCAGQTSDCFWKSLLKFLSNDEVELRTAGLDAVDVLLETVGPVNTHQTDYREQDAHTETAERFMSKGLNLLTLAQALPPSTKAKAYILVEASSMSG